MLSILSGSTEGHPSSIIQYESIGDLDLTASNSVNLYICTLSHRQQNHVFALECRTSPSVRSAQKY
jgi:hypothetical protein